VTRSATAGERGTFYGASERFATLAEIIAACRATLPSDVWDFLDGGAGDEVTLRANRRAFDRWSFRPRVMSGRERPSTATTFLGIPLEVPLLTAPFGADGLFHPDGQLAVARADAAEGVAAIVPEAGTHPLERVAAAAPAAARIAQLHPMGPPGNFSAMLRRIEDAGYQAVCLTVDCPTGGWRERNLRNRFDPDPAVITGNYPADGPVTPEDVFGQLFTRDARVWSWDELAEAMTRTSLPWIAKGILTAEDATAAVRAGASAVLVSNHGGRQLDGAPAALDQLPEVVEAIGGRAQVALDSGVRRGSDVVKALALGADVVILGRLIAYGLAADGEAGVRRVLRLLRAEIETVLTLLGRGGVPDLGPEALRRSPR
jgi:isopentenyl diphosphate isomerase/L-lactate dehydrogenase-like FMN-dependent dehydrogenase